MMVPVSRSTSPLRMESGFHHVRERALRLRSKVVRYARSNESEAFYIFDE